MLSTLDERIKKGLHLFDGTHTPDEDQQIYNDVYGLLFDEMMLFVEANLDKMQRERLFSSLDVIKGEGVDDGTKSQKYVDMVLQSLGTIPYARFQLQSRLEYFLESLILQLK